MAVEVVSDPCSASPLVPSSRSAHTLTRIGTQVLYAMKSFNSLSIRDEWWAHISALYVESTTSPRLSL